MNDHTETDETDETDETGGTDVANGTDGTDVTAGHAGMGLLERRYRAVLRLLPAPYRAEREEEMVAAFMEMSGEVPDELNPRPRWGEIASVLALSTRVRLGAAGATPGQVARGEAVRLVALLGLGTLAAFATAGLIRVAVYGAELSLAGAPESAERLSFISDLAAAVLSILAFVTLARGHVRAAKAATLLGLVPALVHSVLPLVLGGAARLTPPQDLANLAFVLLPPVALLVGFHRDVPPRRRSWALALAPVAAGAALTGLTMLLIAADATEPLWYFMWLDHGAAIPVWAAASLVVLARRRSPSQALALSATGLVLLAIRLPLLEVLPGVLWPTVALQCVLLGTLAAVTGGAGVRGMAKAPGPAPARP